MISEQWRVRLQQYITQIVQNNGHKLIAIYAMPDHLHLCFGFTSTQTIADLVRMVKSDSSKWINENKFTKRKFRWQEGYGVFSYSKSQISRVATYIHNQPIHHQKSNFITEYKGVLDNLGVSYKPEQIFSDLV